VATSLISSYSLVSPPAAHQLFDQIPITACNLYVFNAMLSSLCRSSDIYSARAFFNNIPAKDVVSWSTMLSGYFSHGRLADGLAFFRTMTFTTEFTANYVMLATLLTTGASSGLLPQLCRAIHGYVIRRGVPSGMHLGTLLIDSYAKDGCIDYASRVFARVSSRNVMHWTAMIRGLASHQRNDNPLQMFEEMCQRRVQPNEMTFTAVLGACVQARLVEKGREYFNLMVDRYGLAPNIRQYGYMVDLYAKVGQLEDAYEVIKTMKVEPDVIIWTSLLVACRTFKNFDIAVEGIERALALEISDENVVLYALISDLYAMAGRWDDVINVRRLVEECNMKKNKGLSSIKVDEPLARTDSLFLKASSNGKGTTSGQWIKGWRKLWAVKAPQEMKIVLWRFAHNCLPTGQNLKSRNIPALVTCCHCGREETIDHAFLTCPYVTEIWQELEKACSLRRRLKTFRSARQWLFDYLAISTDEEATTMTITLWHIWQARNDARNGEGQLRPHFVVEKIRADTEMALLHLYKPSNSNMCDPFRPKRWAPPPEGSVMVNVDAALFAESNRIGIGLVIRDHNGRFLAACRRGLEGFTEPEIAEATALRHAVRFVSILPYNQVTFASDCLSLIQKLHATSKDQSQVAAIIQDIKQTTQASITFSFIHVSRCCNVVAHILARSADQLSESVWYSEAPEFIQAALCNDRVNE
jgi:pentatricopeptide repeat protein